MRTTEALWENWSIMGNSEQTLSRQNIFIIVNLIYIFVELLRGITSMWRVGCRGMTCWRHLWCCWSTSPWRPTVTTCWVPSMSCVCGPLSPWPVTSPTNCRPHLTRPAQSSSTTTGGWLWVALGDLGCLGWSWVSWVALGGLGCLGCLGWPWVSWVAFGCLGWPWVSWVALGVLGGLGCLWVALGVLGGLGWPWVSWVVLGVLGGLGCLGCLGWPWVSWVALGVLGGLGCLATF